MSVAAVREAYEGFTVNHAEVGDYDFYGLRRVRLFAGSRVEIECGYIQNVTPERGELVMRLPAKDKSGSAAHMIIHVSVASWTLRISTDPERGAVFTYIGGWDRHAAANRIDIEVDGQCVKLVDL